MWKAIIPGDMTSVEYGDDTYPPGSPVNEPEPGKTYHRFIMAYRSTVDPGSTLDGVWAVMATGPDLYAFHVVPTP